jgi:peptidyl-prolyl cis-trans isomerase B (cyclophilin B)
MSKTKRKNSNYKNNIGNHEVTEEQSFIQKNLQVIIAAAITAVIVVGLIIAAVISSMPKITYVEMEFEGFGKIVLEIDHDTAPITATNFVKLVKSGFYDDLTIFRAQKNFVIQGGKDDSAELTPIKGEFESNGVVNNLSHKRGVISMARTTDPNSATSQFFITLHDNAVNSLDGKYAAFGVVVEGMSVVDAIADNLYDHAIDSMGFVADKDSVKITYAKVINYSK